MDVEVLKQKILDLAIRGKLVPQDPNDEPASALLEKIKAEKAKLVKEGKIKASKEESYIYKGSDNCYYEKIGNKTIDISDEIPFDIPDSWIWTRLKSVGDVIGGGTPSTSVKEYWDNGDIVWVTPAYMSSLESNYINDSYRKITKLGLDKSSAKLMPKGSIIMSSRAPIGYIAINTVEACTSQGCKSLVPYLIETNEFLLYVIKASITRIIEASKGTTFDEISGTKFGEILVPLAPLKEQFKICKLINDSYKTVNAISDDYTCVKDYISIAKRKILDSIFGPNSSYKSYYEINQGKLSNYCTSITKGTTPTSYGFKYLNQGIPFIKVENVSNYRVIRNTINCYISSEANEFQKRSQLKENDVLFSIAGTIGKICLISKNDIPANTNQAFAIISGYSNNILPEYLMYYLEWSKHSDSKVDTHGLGMENATLAGLKNLNIWFPKSINEQRIIVNSLINLLKILDSIIS